jgi:hypothetical protein
MILKRFYFEEEGTEMTLHPCVSVVANLTSLERATIIRALGYVALGGDTDSFPEIEINGEHCTLTPEVIQKFNLAGGVLDPIVTGNDIRLALEGPKADIPPFDPAQLDVVQFLVQTPEGIYPDLDSCRREYTRFTSGRLEYMRYMEQLKISYNDAIRRHDTAVNALNAAKRILTTPVQNDESIQDASFPFEQQLDALQTQFNLIEAKIEDFKKADIVAFKNLIDACTREARETAAVIAEELERLIRFVSESERSLGERGIPIETTLEEYTKTKIELEIVEQKVAGPQISNEKREALESVHEEISLLEDNYKKNATRIEELTRIQEELLRELGFPTWTAYLMAEQVAAADPLIVKELETSKVAYKEAEEKWLRVAAEIQSIEGYLESVEALDEIAATSKIVLGYTEDQDVSNEQIIKRLKSSMISLGDPTPLALETEKALASYGLPVPPGHDIVQMIRIGEEFLANDNANLALINLKRDRENILASIEAVKGQLKLIEEQSMDTAQEVIFQMGALNEAVIETRKEKDRLENEVSAKQELALLYEEGVKKTQNKINDLVLILAENEYIEQNGLHIEETFSPRDLLTNYLFQRFAAVRSVGTGGSFPIVFDDAFIDVPEDLLFVALQEIENYSQGNQVVILTDSQFIGNWALQLGPVQAEVVSSAPSSAFLEAR